MVVHQSQLYVLHASATTIIHGSFRDALGIVSCIGGGVDSTSPLFERHRQDRLSKRRTNKTQGTSEPGVSTDRM